MGSTLSTLHAGQAAAHDIEALGASAAAADAAVHLLVTHPKKLLAHNLDDHNTMLHELAKHGNLLMLQAAVEAVKQSADRLASKAKRHQNRHSHKPSWDSSSSQGSGVATPSGDEGHGHGHAAVSGAHPAHEDFRTQLDHLLERLSFQRLSHQTDMTGPSTGTQVSFDEACHSKTCNGAHAEVASGLPPKHPQHQQGGEKPWMHSQQPAAHPRLAALGGGESGRTSSGSVFGGSSNGGSDGGSHGSGNGHGNGSNSSPQQVLHWVINMENTLHQTPLMEAAMHNHPECVTFLLSQGADPWVRDHCGGRTALHWACLNGHVDCVRALLDHLPQHMETVHGVRYVNCRADAGFTPLHYAAAGGWPAVVLLLLEHSSPEISTHSLIHSFESMMEAFESGSTALHIAAALGDAETASHLLAHYAWRRVTGGIPEDTSELLDPRALPDSHHHLPHQVAAHRHHVELAHALHPSSPLLVVGVLPEDAVAEAKGAGDDGTEKVGMPSVDTAAVGGKPRMCGPLKLSVTAGRALRAKLAADVAAAAGKGADGARAAAEGGDRDRHKAGGSGSGASDVGPGAGAWYGRLVWVPGTGPAEGDTEAVGATDANLPACEVCFGAPANIAVCSLGHGGIKGRCGHGLCEGCAHGLLGELLDHQQRPLSVAELEACKALVVCPFCRGTVWGFEAAR